MPEPLLLEELESPERVLESLKKVEEEALPPNIEKAKDALRDAAQAVGRIAEGMKGMALAYENAWRKIVTNVAKGQTAEMQAARPGFLCHFEQRLGLLKQAYALLTDLHKHGRTDVDPDFLLPEIAGMKQLKDRVFDPWQSAEDLEDLAARDYPLTTADLDQIGPQRRPPASWYSDESKPF